MPSSVGECPSSGPVHTGRGAPYMWALCNMRTQIMEHTAVDGSVHTSKGLPANLHANLLTRPVWMGLQSLRVDNASFPRLNFHERKSGNAALGWILPCERNDWNLLFLQNLWTERQQGKHFPDGAQRQAWITSQDWRLGERRCGKENASPENVVWRSTQRIWWSRRQDADVCQATECAILNLLLTGSVFSLADVSVS